MAKYQVPAVLTTYVCRGFRFPNSPSQSAYAFSPIIDNAQVVHHMILYRTTTYLGDTPFACPSMPAGSTPFWAWAVGGGDFVTPSNTAMDASSYFAMQVHYNNANQAAGITDSSGVKVSFTPRPPQYTTRFLQIGIATGRISLPPRVTVHQSSTCNLPIPVGGSALVWSNGLHGHTRARMIWIDHIRGGQTIGYIGCNPLYDFNRQSFVMRNATVVRGDSLKIHCQWDLTAETTTVVGGESTTNEMCLAFLAFYPIGFSVSSDVTCYGNPVSETPVSTTNVCS